MDGLEEFVEEEVVKNLEDELDPDNEAGWNPFGDSPPAWALPETDGDDGHEDGLTRVSIVAITKAITTTTTTTTTSSSTEMFTPTLEMIIC